MRLQYASVLPQSNKIAEKNKLFGKRIFLFVGRLDTEKNVTLLINCFSKLPQQDNRLIIIGDGKENVKLRQQVLTLKIEVIFTGRVEGDELLSWYNIANIFVLPSTFEPFGAVTNEALLAGCFSIISNKAGSNCLIKENVNGFIFSPDTPDSLLDVMNRAIEITAPNSEKIRLKDNLMQEEYDRIFNHLVKCMLK